MAHAQKPDFIFGRKGRVHLNRLGRQFSRLLAAKFCASALVMLDTPGWEVVWEYWLHTPFASFPYTSPFVRHRVPSGFKRTLLIFHQSMYACYVSRPYKLLIRFLTGFPEYSSSVYNIWQFYPRIITGILTITITHIHLVTRMLRALHTGTNGLCLVSRTLYHFSPKTVLLLSVRGDWECFIEMTAVDYMQTPS